MFLDYDDPIDTATHGATITITRPLDTLFDGIDLETDEDPAKAILKTLRTATTVSVRVSATDEAQ